MKFRKKKAEEANPQQLKRKLLATLSMLLVATVMLTTTSYAWLVLSIAPEVTGIATNVGANGALEIALLTNTTYENPDAIRTTVGESLATRNPTANNTWGNLIDLSYAEYGMNSIMLLPARLKLSGSAESYSVGSNLLSVPTYGYDGRIIKLTDDTLSATYDGSEFSTVIGTPDYGVRAIGTTNTLSVQGSALALAKSNIKTYTNSAKSKVDAILSNNGDVLFNIVINHVMNSDATYTDTELDALKAMLNDLQTVLDYFDLSLRQGIVAFAASAISDKDTFTAVNDRVMDTSRSLSELMNDISEVGTIPEAFGDWVDELEAAQNSLNAAKNAGNALTGGTYTWQQFRGVLDYLMNIDYVYINDTLFSDLDMSTAAGLLGGTVNITLAPGSGIFADVAEFIGNYSSLMTYSGTTIEISTAVSNAPYLTALSESVKDLEAADNSGESQEAVPLTATYGYALDLAFRCNAADSELLLQTTPENRVYEESTTGSTMGGGSYMEFSTQDTDFTAAKMVELMDAIRVAFVDNHNQILGVAKLNTSNRVITDGVINAPLYLYEFGLSEEDGSILMGERRLEDNTITTLAQNEAKAITAIVWLDGDVVDNTMVSATNAASLSGVLNLQFSSSANLVPAQNSDLLNLSADKEDLETLLEENEETLAGGQATYTTVSWNSYTSAYKYANAVYENPNANDNQVYQAALNLTVAKNNLAQVSTAALSAKTNEVRGVMGDSEDPARYLVKNADNTYAIVGQEEFTQEEQDGWNIVGTVYQVDYVNNLHDEGNDILTQIYTDESWSAAAAALYHAEATAMNPKATDSEVNAALTALDTAFNSLQRRVFYKPYDYNGRIYYEAICDANNADTYGKWYTSDFKRVVADVTILNLDAYAEPVDIAKLVQNEYVAWNTEKITPYVEILDTIYPELAGEEILGANWSTFDENFFREVMDQHHVTTLNTLIGIVNDEGLNVDTTEAERLVSSENEVSAATARAEITELSGAVQSALEAKEAQATANDMTASQRILLTAAVNIAKSVDGYNDESNTALAGLRSAVAAVEALLAQESTVTKTEAESALSNINGELSDADAGTVTEYNTLTYTIPVTTEVYDVVYAVEYPGASLALTGKTGETQMKVVVLTKNGVLFTGTRDITIYTPADKVAFYDARNAELGSVTLGMDDSTNISAALYYNPDGHTGNEATLGNVVINEDGTITVHFAEEAARWTWASMDTDIASVSPTGNGGCTITAKGTGTTYITVSILTNAGAEYEPDAVYTGAIAVTVE